MSGFEDNFFDDNNPFSDPSVTEVTHQVGKNQSGLEGYSPFTSNTQSNSGPATSTVGPAIMHPTTQDISPNPPQYSKSPQSVAQYTVEELEKQRRELEERKANLDRREAELRNPNLNFRKNNWPPLPESFCIQPCFYQDINLEIPQAFQKIVRHLYYVWLFHGCVMVLNVIGGLALLFQFGEFVTFGVGILYLILFTPFSFLCWYRPAYKAFSGILRAIACFSSTSSGKPTVGSIVVGILVLMIAFCFVVLAAGQLLLLTRVHTIYRSSEASFKKAQQEFTKEFLGNQHVRNAASDAAAATIRAQLGGNQQTNRY
ncbi:hypothetical protein RUM43_000057 [Polyplax serrata]|uniref:Secretory carrier-associated membrane protein n=1 Tax=Polyplax serrata TaxID=468196 RepID=A0AAN8XMW7_POLSC